MKYGSYNDPIILLVLLSQMNLDFSALLCFGKGQAIAAAARSRPRIKVIGSWCSIHRHSRLNDEIDPFKHHIFCVIQSPKVLVFIPFHSAAACVAIQLANLLQFPLHSIALAQEYREALHICTYSVLAVIHGTKA